LITVHHGRVPCGDSFSAFGPSFASPRASRWRSRVAARQAPLEERTSTRIVFSQLCNTLYPDIAVAFGSAK